MYFNLLALLVLYNNTCLIPFLFAFTSYKLAKKITDGTEKHFKNGTSINLSGTTGPAKEINKQSKKLKKQPKLLEIYKKLLAVVKYILFVN